MENPVTTVERLCADAALTNCEAPQPRRIVRRIEMSLLRE
jgi:hypothetical protein